MCVCRPGDMYPYISVNGCIYVGWWVDVESERGYSNFVKFMSIFRKITNLFEKKLKIEKEIATLQKSCNHSKKKIKAVRENVDSTTPVIRWVCDKCSKILGYPSEQDRNNFFKE